ncbi:MAG TPA: hypothetical protein O0X99_02125 [Methanocorpusculum sp.]|nr:hypothetical protein [Methanocorpusculum sp.]
MITIGIGCDINADTVIDSINKCSDDPLQINCYCKSETLTTTISNPNVKFVISPNPHHNLVDDLFSNKIDGAVRGTLPANETLSYLKKIFEIDKLERVALLETIDHIKFFLAPVGVDEGWTVNEKISLINNCKLFVNRFSNVSHKIAILSGGRLGDIGRHPIIKVY